MTARTHDIIAFAALITLGVLYPPDSLNLVTSGGAVVGNIVGSLLPDLDQASNTLWHLTPLPPLTGGIGRKLFLGHRTISHSILGILIVYFLLTTFLPLIMNASYINIPIITASIMIGYISHLAADSVTKEGLPLLFPLKFKFGLPPAKALRITTGKFTEKFIVFPLTLSYIVWFVGSHQEEALTLLRSIYR